MAFAETQELAVKLSLKDGLTRGINSASRSLSGLDKATSRTQRSLGQLGHNLAKGLTIGLAATAAGFVKAVSLAGDFEAQMHTINTVANLTPTELGKVGDGLRTISKTTGIALSDITSGYYDLVSAGVKGKLAQEALNDAVKLGIGGLATTTETINLMTTAINAYGLDTKGAAKATDEFAQAIADGTVKASDIAATFSNVASVAKAYGVGIDQIAASYAYLTAQGVAAGEVTTEMQRAIVSLINPTKDLAKAGKVMGLDWETEVRKKGLVPALDEIRAYSDKTHTPLIKLLGRIEAVKYTLQTTGPQAEGFAKELDRIRKASGVAAAQMAERQQGLNFQLARLKALASDAGITIGSALLPKLTPLIEKLNTFIQGHASDIADFGKKFADGFSQFADAAGKVDFNGIGQGLALTARVSKDIVSTFLSLPPDIQKLAVAALAINKVGGGIVTSGIKDLLGLALGSLKTITAANVTVIGGNVTGGIPGAAAGAAGGGVGGIIKGAVKFVLPIAGGVAIANVIREAAGISPEQSAASQNTGQFGPRAPRPHTGGGTWAGPVHLAPTTIDKLGHYIMGAAIIEKTATYQNGHYILTGAAETTNAVTGVKTATYQNGHYIQGAGNKTAGAVAKTTSAVHAAKTATYQNGRYILSGAAKTAGASSRTTAAVHAAKTAIYQNGHYILSGASKTAGAVAKATSAVHAVKTATYQNGHYVLAGAGRTVAAIGHTTRAAAAAGARTAMHLKAVHDATVTAGNKAKSGAAGTTAAVKAKRMNVSTTVNVTTKVSARDVVRATSRYNIVAI